MHKRHISIASMPFEPGIESSSRLNDKETDILDVVDAHE